MERADRFMASDADACGLYDCERTYGTRKGVKLTHIGDGRNNVANSLLIGGAKVGMDVRICSPQELFPDQDIVKMAEAFAEESGGKITVTSNTDKAVSGADVLYTDVWVSMGKKTSLQKESNCSSLIK